MLDYKSAKIWIMWNAIILDFGDWSLKYVMEAWMKNKC